MNKRIIGLITALLMTSFLFTACERSATGAKTSVPAEETKPFPVATQPQIMADILSQTQTASAANPSSGGHSLATNTPAFVFNTPEVKPSSTAGTLTAETGEATVSAQVTVTSTPSTSQTNTPEPTATSTGFTYPTPTPGRPATYTLQNGEYPYCIARRFDVNPDDLLSLNGLNAYSVTSPGLVLTIPQSGAFPWERARIAHPATYTVLAGDSMGSIACAFGDADPNTIYAANGLKNGDVLVVGQVINIP